MHRSQQTSLIKAALLSCLRRENIQVDAGLWNQSAEVLREVLGDLLISSGKKWKEDTLQLIDKVWQAEASEINTIDVDSLPSFTSIKGTKLMLWKGDITRLQGNQLAIVNAANDQGLGCFIPNHKCIDNVIHRQAGPRLRLECEEMMKKRSGTLSAGSEPIVTKAYFLPSSHVIHVTGPQIRKDHGVPAMDEDNLRRAYELSLEAAKESGVRAIAFPCISTGLFGFPNDRAAELALSTVQGWLNDNENSIDKVIFNVFTDKDKALYDHLIVSQNIGNINMDIELSESSSRTSAINLAKQWILDADAVLVCAGAGMSVKEGEMVYTNPEDFAKAYPFFPKWGYRTGYETMGLAGDRSVPQTAKWAFWAKHMDNMRWGFTPNDGYKDLLNLVKGKDHFVLTSNVDGCFERSGFNTSQIYTPQGEWTYLQCMGPCRHDSVYEARPYLDQILPHVSNDGNIPADLVPKCPQCGENMFGNVRGGSWFLHHKYQEQNKAIQKWMESHINKGSRVAIIEVGAGFNTPTVTRFVVESFARELGSFGSFIRVNPTEAELPRDLKAVAFEEGWQILGDLVASQGLAKNESGPHDHCVDQAEVYLNARQVMVESKLLIPDGVIAQYQHHLGNFD